MTRHPIAWSVEHCKDLNKPVIFARAIMPGGAEYVTWHVCNGCETPALFGLIIRAMTAEVIQVVQA